MDDIAWAGYQSEAKKAETIRKTLLELYPGHTLLSAYFKGSFDKVIDKNDRSLLRAFYDTELAGGKK